MRTLILSTLLAVACAGCASAPLMRSTLTSPPTPAQSAELWEQPNDLAERNLFDGPWGKELAPNPTTPYAWVNTKTAGISPGFTVTDQNGMEWSVKQGPEAKVEVVMSRILSAVGYHQPPVYYLPRWTISDEPNSTLGGGPALKPQSEARFRPKHTALKAGGEWSWQENPFIGTVPYNGLRVLMLILNESDLKNSNNTLYEVTGPGGAAPRHWYVVRDIGTALGETGRLDPKRNDIGKFERTGFIKGVKDGVVEFDYDGRHRELADHITVADVRWMCDLLAQLQPAQWHDAFRAGGYDRATAEGFIARIKAKIAEGQALPR